MTDKASFFLDNRIKIVHYFGSADALVRGQFGTNCMAILRTLGDDAARVVIGFAGLYTFQYVFLIAFECYFDADCIVFTLFRYYFDAVALSFFRYIELTLIYKFSFISPVS